MYADLFLQVFVLYSWEVNRPRGKNPPRYGFIP